MIESILLALGLSIFIVFLNKKNSKIFLGFLQGKKYNILEYLEYINNSKEKIYKMKKDNKDINSTLVMTKRATRLYRFNLIFNFFISFIFIFLINRYVFSREGNIGKYIILILIYVIYYVSFDKYQEYIFYISASIMKPFEDAINKSFFNEAKEKMKTLDDLKVIGIAGSFGKTSTKFITSTILKEKFNVLETPESYNTTMGVSKIINDELNDSYDIFITELGARSIEEIEVLTDLLQPDIGVITSIGPVHLETFKNIDNIMKTKFELIEDLPTKGVAVFNYDNEYIKKLADKTFKEKINYGIENSENLDIFAEDIIISHEGSEFTLKDKNNNSIKCRTKLLGKHNISNILAGASIALSLGLSLEEIKTGISKIEPIDHRLNVKKIKNNITVIDDSYNSNPIGAKAALDVISHFKEGKKIIVTPGMINLGMMELDANFEFGNNIAKVCDYVILIKNESSKYVYEGIISQNYNKDNIIIVEDAKQASKEVFKIAKEKDIVLFESDIIIDK